MKSLTSFTNLPLTKGLLLLADDKTKIEVESHILKYIEAQGDCEIAIVPLVRYLFEKIDIKGDDLKIVLCAVLYNNKERYRIQYGSRYHMQEGSQEKKLMPLIDDRYVYSIIYTSDEKAEQRKKEIDEIDWSMEILAFDDIEALDSK